MQRPELHRFTEPLTMLLLAGVCYVLFFHGLSDIGLIGPDEPRYAAVAREMYQSGDYITPRLKGEPWFEKPVLMYWGVAASYAVFGVGEFASRFPSAFGATLCVFFIYFVSRRLWGRPTAIWACLSLASSVGYFAFARAASMDMPLTVCLTMAMLSFLVAYNSNSRHRHWWFLAFYAFVGFGVLAKGPVAIALPALSLCGFLLFQGRFNEWKEWYPRYAWIILAIAAPWYIAVTWINGFEFIRVFLINQNFARFTSTIHGHPRPFYFYIPDFMMLTFPWTFLIIPALRRQFDRNDRLMLWWAIVPIVFFSLSGSKLPGYILPSVPAAMMFFAREIPKGHSRPFRIGVFIEAGAMLLVGVTFGFFSHLLTVDSHVNGSVILGVTCGLAAVLVAIALWLKPPIWASFNLAAMILLVLVTTTFVLPMFEMSDTMRPWQPILRKIVADDHIVILYRPKPWMEYGMEFYRLNKTRSVYSPEELDTVLSPAKTLFVADEKGMLDMGEAGAEIEVLETIGNQTAFWAWQAR
jgi:4-amino-4-deoxy-L-arabinose transferase-like glycosyltransferase